MSNFLESVFKILLTQAPSWRWRVKAPLFIAALSINNQKSVYGILQETLWKLLSGISLYKPSKDGQIIGISIGK